MNKRELIQRLHDIEWEDFEVKDASGGLPKNIWETVSAFSNTAGGWIVLGIHQQGKRYFIKGLPAPEKTEQDFTNTLRGEKFNIKIRPGCKKYSFSEGTVLAFYIPLSDKKPIYFNTPANTFVRTASGDQRATKEEIDALFRDQAFGTQTDKVIDGLGMARLHTASVNQYREYMQRVNPAHPYNRLTNEELLEKLRILVEGRLTYSGLLFLGENDAIQSVFTDFRIDYFEVPATDYASANPRYTFRLEEQENLWQYFFALFDRLRRSLDLPFQLTPEGFASDEYPQLEALREALVNLLMHTDYFSPAKPRIRVFTDRIEFFNPGALPKPLATIMREDISIPRNGILAKLFRVVRLAENGGYGFDKMIRGWTPYAGTEPLFEASIDSVKATFRFKNKDKEKGGALDGEKGDAIVLTEKQKELLKMIEKDHKLSVRKLSREWDINFSAAQAHFDALKNKGIIKREGGTRGYWKILNRH